MIIRIMKGEAGLQQCLRDQYYTNESAIRKLIKNENLEVDDVYFPTFLPVPDAFDEVTEDTVRIVGFESGQSRSVFTLNSYWVLIHQGDVYTDSEYLDI